jgi:hypothetical protein
MAHYHKEEEKEEATAAGQAWWQSAGRPLSVGSNEGS